MPVLRLCALVSDSKSYLKIFHISSAISYFFVCFQILYNFDEKGRSCFLLIFKTQKQRQTKEYIRAETTTTRDK